LCACRDLRSRDALDEKVAAFIPQPDCEAKLSILVLLPGRGWRACCWIAPRSPAPTSLCCASSNTAQCVLELVACARARQCAGDPSSLLCCGRRFSRTSARW
jgi:hypothetical protein